VSVKETPEYYQLVLNILCDLICDIISFCAPSFAMGKYNVYDQIISKNLKMRRHGNQTNFT